MSLINLFNFGKMLQKKTLFILYLIKTLLK